MPMKSAAAKAILSLSLGVTPSGGAGNAAIFVNDKLRKSRERLFESQTLGYMSTLESVYRLAQECSESDWDGYGALPINAGAITNAGQLLYALPPGTPAPSVGAEPDGHLTFEWYKTPRWTLSVSISPDGNLHYSGLFGAASQFGTEPFLGQAPQSILELVNQVSRS